MKVDYVPICKKYGSLPVLTTMAVAAIAGIFFNQNLFNIATNVGLIVAMIGGDFLLVPAMKVAKIRATKGSIILRRFEFACAALGVCSGLALQTLANIESAPQPHRPPAHQSAASQKTALQK